jgi:hypothetical protein
MATTQVANPAQGASAPAFSSPSQMTLSAPQSTALTIRLAPEPKPEPPLYENPTVIASASAAALAFFGVVVTVGITSWLRSRDLRHAAALAKDERDHSRELANSERENSREQARIEREHAVEQAALERQHSSNEAQRARLMEIRKGVYMQLVDQFMKVMEMLGEMPTINVQHNPKFVSPLLDLGATVHKTWLLSEVDTALKTRELHSRVNELFFRLVARMPAMQMIKLRIADAEERRVAAVAEQNRLQVVQDQAQIAGNHVAVLGAMQGRTAQMDISAQALANIAAGHQEHEVLARDFRGYLQPQVNGLLEQIQDVVIAARTELGLADSELLRAQTVEMRERVSRAVGDLEAAIQPQQG